MKTLALVGLGVLSLGASGQDLDKEVRTVEEQRYRAMVQADIAALGRLLADDLVYVHSSGSIDGREQLLGSIRAGTRKYKKITPEDTRYRVAGTLAVVTGRATIDVENDGKPQTVRARFTAVYDKGASGWRLGSWQTTRLPES